MKNFMLLMLPFLANTAYAQTDLDFFDIDDIATYTENKEKQPENIAQKTAESSKDKTTVDYSNLSEDDFARIAQDSAGMILEQKQNMLNLRDSQKRLIEEGEKKRLQLIEISKKAQEEQQAVTDMNDSPDNKIAKEIKLIAQKHDSAPFGLFWGIDKEQTEMLGFELQSAERKDYTNVYNIANPKQTVQTFNIVTAIFGEQNKLWCIFAQSTPQKDTPKASEVLNLYHKYYDALEQKYGNAKQYFTPYTYTEELTNEENQKQQKEKITKTNSIGNDNFLAELQSGNAVLYATFENNKIGITLGVSVDGDGKSYISLDYKNLKIMEEERQTKLNNLISDI